MALLTAGAAGAAACCIPSQQDRTSLGCKARQRPKLSARSRRIVEVGHQRPDKLVSSRRPQSHRRFYASLRHPMHTVELTIPTFHTHGGPAGRITWPPVLVVPLAVLGEAHIPENRLLREICAFATMMLVIAAAISSSRAKTAVKTG